MPDVSVLMPAYNLSRYPEGWVERAVRSVKSQGAELCVGDDFSSDNTADILRAIDPEVKIGRTTYNTGGGLASNEAAELATGRYFILLSARSWYSPGSLIAMARYLDEHPEVGFVYGFTRFYMEDGRIFLKMPNPFSRDEFKRTFASSFGYMYRREAWDEGHRYGCQIYIPEEDKYMTIGDRHMVMNLIFRMGWDGYCIDGLKTLNYVLGVVPQQNDLFKKYNSRMMAEYHRLWSDVLPAQ